MNHIQFGLLCEGDTDRRALAPIFAKAIDWLNCRSVFRTQFSWYLNDDCGKSSNEQILRTLSEREHDVVLVHRDGAGSGANVRRSIQEISSALCPVVVVRELEAWLIADGDAMRTATRASSETLLRTYRHPKLVEKEFNPKQVLKANLDSCLPGRRRQGDDWYGLIAEELSIHVLVRIPAFAEFLRDLESAISRLVWPVR